MKYSKLQYFLWLVSGSEIRTLKDCPEDYNRHANIGMMIVITSLFACVTAFIAGKTFAHSNTLGVFIFSILWGVLIFTLDRSMVNSIKRDPDAKSQAFWSYFIPRFILAIILAFFMSVPLDHIVFPEAIERQMKINVHNDWLQRQTELNKGYNVSQQERGITRLETELNKLDSTLKSDCNLPAFLDAQENYNTSAAKIPALQAAYNDRLNARNSYYRQLQQSQNANRPQLNSTWHSLNDRCKSAMKALNAQLNESQSFKQEALRIEREWRDEMQAKYNSKDSAYTASGNKLQANKDSIEVDAENFKKDLQSMNGFDTKFATLFLMPNWGVQILKWAIFLALLVIEILPTFLKLRTPIGEYDIEISKKEKAHRNRAIHFLSTEDEIVKQSEEHRKEKEITLNKEITDKIAKIELGLATKALDDWETTAIAEVEAEETLT